MFLKNCVMAAHSCKYSADVFCYLCSEFFAKRAKKHCLNNCIRAGEAYLLISECQLVTKINVGHHMSSMTTVVALLEVS